MNYKALNKVFSNAVAAKLAEGFTICTQTMAGSQGEDAVEDLQLAIQGAEAQRNKEPARNGARIWRKW